MKPTDRHDPDRNPASGGNTRDPLDGESFSDGEPGISRRSLSALVHREIVRDNGRQKIEESHYRFDVFAGVTVDQMLGREPCEFSDNPDYKLLRELITIDKRSMTQMNAQGLALPNDTVETLLDGMTRQGAVVAVIDGIIKEASGLSEKKAICSFSIGFKPIKHAPDYQDIPQELLEEPAIRGWRLFETPAGKQYLSRGEAATLAWKALVKLADDGHIIGKVLLDSRPQWRAARMALERRGMDITDFAAIETVKHLDGSEVVCHFAWGLYPPKDEEAIRKLEAHTRKYQTLELWEQERLAPVTAHCQGGSARITCLSQANDPYALAQLYPANFVTGMHLDSDDGPRRKDERALNLRTLQIGQDLDLGLEPESQDTICLFSVLPDIAKLDPENAKKNIQKVLEQCVRALKLGGKLIVRDTVKPEGPKEVLMDLRSDDGQSSGPYKERSTAARFEYFIEKLQASGTLNEPLNLDQQLSPAQKGFKRYRVPSSLYAEFTHKKDYIPDIDFEITRIFTACTSTELSQPVIGRGMRELRSREFLSDWIKQNRRDNQVRAFSLDGKLLANLPSNWVGVYEKVPPENGVILEEENAHDVEKSNFLRTLSFYRLNPETNEPQRRDVLSRPNSTIDLIPWFKKDAMLWMVGKQEFPRPILEAVRKSLDNSRHAGYITEQLSAIVKEVDLATTEGQKRSAIKIARSRGRISAELIKKIDPRELCRYYTGHGITDEEVWAMPVETKTLLEGCRDIPSYSKFSTSGTRQAFPVNQLLRACQTKGMIDPRMERIAYQLILRHNSPAGRWAGADIAGNLRTQAVVPGLRFASPEEVLEHPKEHVFEQLENAGPGLWRIRNGHFVEKNAAGEIIAEDDLEYGIPSEESGLTGDMAVVVPIMRLNTPEGVKDFIGLHVIDDSPTAQLRSDTSWLTTLPTFLLPESLQHEDELQVRIPMDMYKNFHVNSTNCWLMGGWNAISPGATPGKMCTVALEIKAESAVNSGLCWVELPPWLPHVEHSRCGLQMTGSYRIGHALGHIPTL